MLPLESAPQWLQQRVWFRWITSPAQANCVVSEGMSQSVPGGVDVVHSHSAARAAACMTACAWPQYCRSQTLPPLQVGERRTALKGSLTAA